MKPHVVFEWQEVHALAPNRPKQPNASDYLKPLPQQPTDEPLKPVLALRQHPNPLMLADLFENGHDEKARLLCLSHVCAHIHKHVKRLGDTDVCFL
jgi:aminoglycoside phosphotransferase family enzyme